MRLIALLLALCPSVVVAQDSLNRSASLGVPKFVLKTNATTLINPYKQAFMLTADFRVAPRITIDAGAGMIFNSTLFANQKGESYRGPRLRLGAKYFYASKEKISGYLGFELKYNSITHRLWGNTLRQGGQYAEIRLNERSVKTWGGAFRFGVPYYSGARKRLIVEPYFGLGAMVHHVSFRLPPDATRIERRELFSFEYPAGRTSGLDVLYGVHIGYVVW